MSYYYGDARISSMQIRTRLQQEKRTTAKCPFCSSFRIRPVNSGVSFFMECQTCFATGPSVRDYDDPNGLNESSWTYALKVCHDRWNGSGVREEREVVFYD